MLQTEGEWESFKHWQDFSEGTLNSMNTLEKGRKLHVTKP